MYYHIVPDLKLIYAWSPKCACTTVKSAVLMALGHKITGNVHNDMLTQENLRSGKYGIHPLGAYRQKFDFNRNDYLKVCVIRNPYFRFISAIRQRSHSLCKQQIFSGMTASDYLEYMGSNDYGEDHHFHPQTRNLRKFAFDQVFDISQMEMFFKILDLEYNGERFGRHATVYGGKDDILHSASLSDLMMRNEFPESVHAWLDDVGTEKLRALFAGDFDFARSHGYDYELPPRMVSEEGRSKQ